MAVVVVDEVMARVGKVGRGLEEADWTNYGWNLGAL